VILPPHSPYTEPDFPTRLLYWTQYHHQLYNSLSSSRALGSQFAHLKPPLPFLLARDTPHLFLTCSISAETLNFVHFLSLPKVPESRKQSMRCFEASSVILVLFPDRGRCWSFKRGAPGKISSPKPFLVPVLSCVCACCFWNPVFPSPFRFLYTRQVPICRSIRRLVGKTWAT